MAFFITFPIFILGSIALIVFYFTTRKKIALVLIGIFWCAPILAYFLRIWEPWQPLILKKTNFYGEFKIDTKFYPGKNSQWEYDHFTFKILDGDSFKLNILDQNKIIKTYSGKIAWNNNGPPWIIKIECAQPIFDQPIVLYRKINYFYFVWHSKKYKNMFFKKI